MSTERLEPWACLGGPEGELLVAAVGTRGTFDRVWLAERAAVSRRVLGRGLPVLVELGLIIQQDAEAYQFAGDEALGGWLAEVIEVMVGVRQPPSLLRGRPLAAEGDRSLAAVQRRLAVRRLDGITARVNWVEDLLQGAWSARRVERIREHIHGLIPLQQACREVGDALVAEDGRPLVPLRDACRAAERGRRAIAAHIEQDKGRPAAALGLDLVCCELLVQTEQDLRAFERYLVALTALA